MSVVPLNSTAAVNVSWTRVNLTVVHHYTVHYTTVGGGSGRRQSSTQMFPGPASSGVVGGLMTGQQYQFRVSVTLALANGQLYTGPVSTPSDPVTVSGPQPTPTPSPPPAVATSSRVSGLMVGLVMVCVLLVISLVGNAIILYMKRTSIGKESKHPVMSPLDWCLSVVEQTGHHL